MSDLLAREDGTSNVFPEPEVDASEAFSALQRIITSRHLSRSPVLCRFLAFIVDKTLAGRTTDVKEYVIATEVLNRSDSFDPRTDSIVRVEANRLRQKLRAYYELEGREDPIAISIANGAYRASFERRPTRFNGLRPVRQNGNQRPYSSEYRCARGFYFLSHGSKEAVERSIHEFRQVTLAAPADPSGWGGLAYALSRLLWLDAAPPEALLREIEACSAKALQLDPRNAEGLYSRAVVDFARERDPDSTLRLLEMSSERKPSELGFALSRALVLFVAGREREACDVIRRIRPGRLSLSSELLAGLHAFFGGSPESAAECFQRAVDLENKSPVSYALLGFALMHSRDYDAAADAYHEAHTLRPECSTIASSRAYSFVKAQRTKEGRRLATELLESANKRYVSRVDLAKAWLALGQRDQARWSLEQATREHSAQAALIRIIPEFCIEQLGLPQKAVGRRG